MIKNRRIFFRQITSFLLVAVISFSFYVPQVNAEHDQFEQQIRDLQNQVSQQQAEVTNLRARKNNLENQIALLNAQIASTTAQLNLAQANYNKTTAELAEAEDQLARKKLVLAESIRTIYLEGQITPIEMLASSDNFSEFVDRQQYLQALKEKVDQALDEVTKLKIVLEDQKQKQGALLVEQNALKQSLDRQRGEASYLLAQTKGEESRYQTLIRDNQNKISQLKAQQAEAIARNSFNVRRGGTGGYPYANACTDGSGRFYGNDDYPPPGYPWCPPDERGFYLRQCTSYAAWRRLNMRGDVPVVGGNANANQWRFRASERGYNVVTRPVSPGDIAIDESGPYGHVMVVEQILDGGNRILVSQYNADMNNGGGNYSTAERNSAGLWFITTRR